MTFGPEFKMSPNFKLAPTFGAAKTQNQCAHTIASSTSAPPAIGCRISPSTVAMKIATRRHASGFTAAGRGSRYATAQ